MATKGEVKKSLNIIDSLVINKTNEPRVKIAVDDCKDFMESTVQDLEALFSYVSDSEIQTMHYHKDPNQSHPIKDQLSNGMLNIRQLAINFLAIVDGLEIVLEKFNLKIDIHGTNTSHRLLEEDKYLSWVSGADCELLAKVDNGPIKPNRVVAKDGSGQFKTIGEALATYPKNF
ncbi:pectinesterase-like [Tripterygium wilfordii]|uniref:Pectinesterase-like n=1 Tax=Tripterygium wilfordii TaxID=458696 RepID=A0A7J7CGJ0_TRIWF|nr:pectinesterase-like [Tripterygium wilfordii]